MFRIKKAPSGAQGARRSGKIALLVAVLVSSACISTPPRSAPAVYDFGAPPQRSAGGWANVALDVRAPAWLDTPGIAYRLTYEDPLRWRNYADSRWADSPVRLLGQQLRQQLGIMEKAHGVATAGCLLRVELQSFSQSFAAPQQSHGVLQAAVVLVDKRRQVQAERMFSVEESAATPDARGGVQALVAAGSAFGRLLATWLADEPAAQACKQLTIR